MNTPAFPAASTPPFSLGAGGRRVGADAQEPVIYPKLGAPWHGQLGNQLWQIAGTLGIAARLQRDARFPGWRYQQHFSIPDRHFCAEPITGIDAVSCAPHIPPFPRRYLQDAGLWRQIEPTVRRYFAPSERTRADLDRRFADFDAIPAKTAVHVRRGDYVLQPNRFPLPSEEYWRIALDLLYGTNVVVFSDDIPWCRANLGWAEPALFMEGNEDHEDLFLMARCDHHVIANSSFSWWGAFLSGDPTPIFPKRWYGPAIAADPKLMFLDGWVGIDV